MGYGGQNLAQIFSFLEEEKKKKKAPQVNPMEALSKSVQTGLQRAFNPKVAPTNLIETPSGYAGERSKGFFQGSEIVGGQKALESLQKNPFQAKPKTKEAKEAIAPYYADAVVKAKPDNEGRSQYLDSVLGPLKDQIEENSFQALQSALDSTLKEIDTDNYKKTTQQYKEQTKDLPSSVKSSLKQQIRQETEGGKPSLMQSNPALAQSLEFGTTLAGTGLGFVAGGAGTILSGGTASPVVNPVTGSIVGATGADIFNQLVIEGKKPDELDRTRLITTAALSGIPFLTKIPAIAKLATTSPKLFKAIELATTGNINPKAGLATKALAQGGQNIVSDAVVSKLTGEKYGIEEATASGVLGTGIGVGAEVLPQFLQKTRASKTAKGIEAETYRKIREGEANLGKADLGKVLNIKEQLKDVDFDEAFKNLTPDEQKIYGNSKSPAFRERVQGDLELEGFRGIQENRSYRTQGDKSQAILKGQETKGLNKLIQQEGLEGASQAVEPPAQRLNYTVLDKQIGEEGKLAKKTPEELQRILNAIEYDRNNTFKNDSNELINLERRKQAVERAFGESELAQLNKNYSGVDSYFEGTLKTNLSDQNLRAVQNQIIKDFDDPNNFNSPKTQEALTRRYNQIEEELKRRQSVKDAELQAKEDAEFNKMLEGEKKEQNKSFVRRVQSTLKQINEKSPDFDKKLNELYDTVNNSDLAPEQKEILSLRISEKSGNLVDKVKKQEGQAEADRLSREAFEKQQSERIQEQEEINRLNEEGRDIDVGINQAKNNIKGFKQFFQAFNEVKNKIKSSERRFSEKKLKTQLNAVLNNLLKTDAGQNWLQTKDNARYKISKRTDPKTGETQYTFNSDVYSKESLLADLKEAFGGENTEEYSNIARQIEDDFRREKQELDMQSDEVRQTYDQLKSLTDNSRPEYEAALSRLEQLKQARLENKKKIGEAKGRQKINELKRKSSSTPRSKTEVKPDGTIKENQTVQEQKTSANTKTLETVIRQLETELEDNAYTKEERTKKQQLLNSLKQELKETENSNSKGESQTVQEPKSPAPDTNDGTKTENQAGAGSKVSENPTGKQSLPDEEPLFRDEPQSKVGETEEPKLTKKQKTLSYTETLKAEEQQLNKEIFQGMSDKYSPRFNEELFETAKKKYFEDDGSFDLVKIKDDIVDNLSDEAVVAGNLAIKALSDAGETGRARDLAEVLSDRLMQAGRIIQAARIAGKDPITNTLNYINKARNKALKELGGEKAKDYENLKKMQDDFSKMIDKARDNLDINWCD